jgi:hypothetical protein
MKPSDLSPLFSDEDASPEEIARARKIVAREELKGLVKEYRRLARDIDYTTPSDSSIWKLWKDCRDPIIANVLELIPEEEGKP